MVSAVVLAGGRRTYAATAEFDGDPLVRRVARRLAPAVDDVVVTCRADRRDAVAGALSDVTHRFAVDPVPDGGPVAEVRAGCRVARDRWTFVTACTRPFVGSDLVTELVGAASDDGAVPHVEGRPRPLAAVYRTEAAVEAADTTLRVGANAATALLDRLSTTAVTDPVPARALADVDAPGDLDATTAAPE